LAIIKYFSKDFMGCSMLTKPAWLAW